VAIEACDEPSPVAAPPEGIELTVTQPVNVCVPHFTVTAHVPGLALELIMPTPPVLFDSIERAIGAAKAAEVAVPVEATHWVPKTDT
jgi:hypothetical protein